MNYLTDKGFFLGCIDEVQYRDLFPADASTQSNFEWNLPTPAVNYDFKIAAISHKRKNSMNADHVFIAYGNYNFGTTLKNSYVLFIPNYLDAGAAVPPPNPTTAALAGSKLFEIPNKIDVIAPFDIPEVLFLEAIPENSFFITADDLGSMHVIDSNSNDLPYPATSIYFEVENGNTIIGLKYRGLLSTFVVGLSTGTAKMYVFNLVNMPPVIMNHGGTLSAIEVFKFDDRVMTGGSDGSIKVWNTADLVLGTENAIQTGITYNDDGSKGGQVTGVSWIISTNFFISCH
jgi:hypothetical protein